MLVRRIVNGLKVFGNAFTLGPGYEGHAVTDQMNDAKLNLGLRIDLKGGPGKAFKPVNAEDEHIFDAVLLKLCEHAQPEFGILFKVFGNAIPILYQQGIYFSDFWEAYEAVIPDGQHQAVSKKATLLRMSNASTIP